jgi:pyruvate dehydrogenase (quinone)
MRPDQIFLDCTKYIGYVTSAAQMPRIVELAMQAAILERGVGMIILPGDVSAAPIEHPMLEHPIATKRSRVRPPDRDLDRVADLIAKSEHIAIFGGAGCMEARAEVLQLSQLLNAPIGFTFRGKDILEAANPNAVGMTGLLRSGSGCLGCSIHGPEELLSCARKAQEVKNLLPRFCCPELLSEQYDRRISLFYPLLGGITK